MKFILKKYFSFNSPYVYLKWNKDNKITEKNKIKKTYISFYKHQLKNN